MWGFLNADVNGIKWLKLQYSSREGPLRLTERGQLCPSHVAYRTVLSTSVMIVACLNVSVHSLICFDHEHVNSIQQYNVLQYEGDKNLT